MNHTRTMIFSQTRRASAALLLSGSFAFAAIPPVEKLLPNDTLFVCAVPDCPKFSRLVERSPQAGLWNDAAMKPFRDKFMEKCSEELIKPLEQELGVRLSDYTALLQGQFALAVTPDGWPGQEGAEPGIVLLLDAKDKGGQLKTNLTELRKKWSDAGKAVKTEKIRDVEFSIVPLSTNDLPATLKKFFPQKQEIQELGKEPEKKTEEKNELIIGQYESLLILASSVKTVESIAAHLTGGSAPALADDAGFEQNRLALFREAAGYAWFNATRFFESYAKLPKEKPSQVPTPLPLPEPDKVIGGLGFAGLKSLAFTLRDLPEGSLGEFFIGAPEANRKGLTKLAAVDAKEASPPPFVPADAVKFQRWRLDGQKTIGTLEKMLGEISPQFLNTWNFLLKSGEDMMKQSNADYDLRKSVFGNLGDDLITYEKPPRGNSPAELAAPPSLFAIGSPDAEALSRALSGVLIIRFGDAMSPKTREFLGRKIYSVSLPSGRGADAGSLNYTAGSGYVTFSTDTALIEEFIRSAESPGKPLREAAGLADAAQRVGGFGTGVFCYENQAESMRVAFELFKKQPPATGGSLTGSNPLTSALPFASAEKSWRAWMDFSLLPDFAKVSRYFTLSVWAASTTTEGTSFKFFTPAPGTPK